MWTVGKSVEGNTLLHQRVFPWIPKCMCSWCSAYNSIQLHGVFQALRIIPFPDLIQLELTKLGFKVSKKYLPAPILAISNANGGEKNINIKLGTKQSQTFKNIKVICLATVFCVEVYNNT